MTTADDVRTTRERLGWTQQQLADEISVALRTVQYWENGGRRPRPFLKDTLDRIVKAHGATAQLNGNIR